MPRLRRRPTARMLLFAALAAIMVQISAPAADAVAEFQQRSAINDPSGNTPGSYELTLPDSGWSETFVLDAASPRGVSVPLWPTQQHTIEVGGTFSYDAAAGEGNRLADAECSIDRTSGLPDGERWESHRWTKMEGTDRRDILDLKVWQAGGIASFDWEPAQPSDTPACSTDHVYRVTFVPNAGEIVLFIDDAPADNAGSLAITVSRGPLAVTRAVQGTGYQCGKYMDDSFRDTGEKVYGLDRAALTLDSRRNPGETPAPGRERDASGGPRWAYWKETGHNGVYTCNWPAPGTGYHIIISGVYKYDQTAPPGFALADAECSTGYQKGPDSDLMRLIPHYYRPMMEFLAANRANHDARAGHGDIGPFNPYGAAWEARRFEYDNGTPKHADLLDVLINGECCRYQPLHPDPDNPDCSDDLDHDGDGRPDHAYVLDVDPDTPGLESWYGAPWPIVFQTYDLVTYNEWDNCGLLQIRVDRVGTSAPAPATVAPRVGSESCNWVPPAWASQVMVEDFAFRATDILVRSGTQVVWHAIGLSPHTVTALDGSFDSSPDCPDNPLACLTRGGSFSFTATTPPGTTKTITYHCKVHQGMAGSITVVP